MAKMVPIFYFSIFFIFAKFVTTAPPYCEILAKVVSETKTPFLFKIEVPNQQQVEQLIFEGLGTKSVILHGINCAAGWWQLNTFKRDPNGQWQIGKLTRAKIDGAGAEMEIRVDNTLQPKISSRYKIACGESVFCAGRRR